MPSRQDYATLNLHKIIITHLWYYKYVAMVIPLSLFSSV
jgi:hypothetical protein